MTYWWHLLGWISRSHYELERMVNGTYAWTWRDLYSSPLRPEDFAYYLPRAVAP